jgi:hypothetical protein
MGCATNTLCSRLNSSTSARTTNLKARFGSMKDTGRMTHMTDLVPLFPRQPVPPLNVNLAGGGLFDLRSERPKHFTLLSFYRGLHCPICRSQLRELESKLDEFDKRGVAVVAVSSDSKQRAMQTRETWELSRLRIGYGLDLAAARSWGLFILLFRKPARLHVHLHIDSRIRDSSIMRRTVTTRLIGQLRRSLQVRHRTNQDAELLPSPR